MQKAIFIGRQEQVDAVYAETLRQEMFDMLEFPYESRTFTKEELSQYDFSEIAVLFSTWGMCALTEEEITTYFPALEAVFYAAGSVQHFARPFLNKGIRVYSAWAANAVPVAEYTFAQIVLASKGFFTRMHLPMSEEQLQPEKKQQFVGVYPGNYEITVGIIGAGMIGKMVIERLKNHLEQIRVLVFDPFLPQETADRLGVTLCDLQTLFAESDVISNHLANLPQTVGMLNGALFERMKPYATFINTGRGAQVVEQDLIRALHEVPTRAALLDVTDPEPPVVESAFYRMRNVFLTPHIAGSLGNEIHRMSEYMFAEYRRYAAGEPCLYQVTAEMLKTMA